MEEKKKKSLAPRDISKLRIFLVKSMSNVKPRPLSFLDLNQVPERNHKNIQCVGVDMTG